MSRKRKIAFTATTALFVVGILPGAIMNLAQPDLVLDTSQQLGIPLALLTLVGSWKFLGVAALVTPRVGRLAEWAYAGFFFDLTGAAYLHAAADDLAGTPPSLALLGLLIASYVLRPRVADADAAARDRAPQPEPRFGLAQTSS